jgi:hypothetical protein
MQKRILCYAVACLLSLNLSSTYIYEANQSLIDLTNQSSTTSLNAGDDQVSSVFNLGFTFDFYGETFTQGRMATNGCLHFKTSGAYCNDFTPDPLASQYTYTLLPFWTDLIRDSGSSMLAKSFSDKTVFGWYDMREYNRASDNSFEVILWTNDTFEFRYGALDIINHDVLIGEVGSGSKEIYQYYYHDECNTGSTNSNSCVNTDWNNTDKNTNLENGGSLFGPGNGVDCGNPLNDVSCTGYWEAYDDQQCDQDPQYAPFCRGYNQQDSVAYFEEAEDYGYQEEDMWYDEEYDEWLDPNDPCYENRCEGFTDADWYELDVEQFGQEQVDEWMGAEVGFSDDGMIEWDNTPVNSYEEIDVMMDVWDIEQEQHRQEDHMLEEFLFQESFLVEDYREPETFIEFETIEELEEWFDEETNENVEERIEEELADLDEPEEEFIEEIFEEEVVEEVFEAIEERIAEAEIEEERLEREEVIEEFEEVFEEEFQTAEREEATGKSSISRDMALQIVSSTISTAKKSISGTNSGSSVHATGTSVASGSSSSSSNSGFSTSSSPSISDQFASASVQTNETLSMSIDSSSSVGSTADISTAATFETTTETVVADVQVQNVQGEIDTAVSDMSTTSDADQIADQIIAANIKEQQEEIEQEQEDTGQYGDESTLVALIGYVPDFDQYRTSFVPDQKKWYSERVIYTTILTDNTQAFYGLAGQNIRTLSKMKEMQPAL